MRGKEAAVNEERNRLDDLNIEEAVGRTTPPDLTARILGAASQPALEDAPTPISGAHAVPRSVRPQGRRMTAAIPRRNWQGAGIVAAFMLVMAIGLVAFMAWKSPSLKQPTSTAGQPKTTTEPAIKPANQSPSREQRDEPPKSNQSPGPQPEPEPDDSVEQPQQEPDDPIEQHKPEPKPDDTVEQPKPEPAPDDTVEQPRPEPKPDDTIEQPEPRPDNGRKTDVQPEPKTALVASFPAATRENDRDYRYAVRSAEGKWDAEPLYRAKNDGTLRISLHAGEELKLSSAPLNLVSGAVVHGDCVLSIADVPHGHAITLVEDDLWLDSTGLTSSLSVKYEGLVAEATGAAAVFEADGRKLRILCAAGCVRCGEEVIRAGEQASLSTHGLSGLRAWSGDHKLREAAPWHTLLNVEFDVEPENGLIEGERTRTASYDQPTDGWMAFQSGRDAKVSLRFDENEALHPGTHVIIRFKQSGAKKLILQFWNTDAADNFGIDLKAEKDGEWQIVTLPIEQFKDRETGKIAAKDGDAWMSGGVYLEGADTDLFVDYIRLVRKP
jgi:outer membrane biosynthesis protein TonB